MASGDPIYLSLNDKPRAIVDVMDGLIKRHDDYLVQYNRTGWMAPLLFLAGFPFIAVDWLLGYNVCLFSLIAAALWVSAFFVLLARARGNMNKTFPAEYQPIRQVIQTLRDDLSPKQNLIGHLDLTGPRQKSKLARTGKDLHKAEVSYYRDAWFQVKAKLYDGNVLRLAAINRVKAHNGYFKRGRSGKMKWKGGKTQTEQELAIRMAVNPEVYQIKMPHQKAFGKLGQYTVSELTNDSGIINLVASTTAQTIQAEDILGVLRFTYNLLDRKEKTQ